MAMTEDEFVSFYSASYDDLVRYVRRRSPADVVEDVVAETFTIAWRKRGALSAGGRPWLFRTASNTLRNALRKRKRQLEISARLAIETTDSIDDDQIDVVQAWRRLKVRDREVLALHLWEGLSDGDAGKVLGCTRAAFSMRLSRAKQRLGRLLRSSADSLTAPTPVVPQSTGEQA